MGHMHPSRIRRFTSQVLLVALLVSVLTGCSSFNREYQQALTLPPAAGSIEGAWLGSWLSDKNGHHGELRGLITRVEGNTHRTRFKARYWKIFSYTSEVDFEMQPHHDGFEFSGTKRLGWLAGGDYFYEGRVSPEKFFSTYSCKWDHGTFRMERPGPEP